MNQLIFKSHIAKHLKSLRNKKKLSLDAAAKATGVSKAMLGQIEREESSPTISTLWKISSGLETSFSAFFADEPQLCSSETIFPNDPDMKIKTLFPFKADAGLEVFEITLTGHHKQMSSPHGAGVIEHIHVLEGQLSIYSDGEWHLLNSGESMRFFSDQAHGYQAISATVIFHNIVCYQL
ncbi:MAG: transcriptional regulator with XRE-family HTH domain [Psychromonas sp.]|jgi:transcriptional regulator with XRE-family HTH domain|uniref:helix-turn-helix domain-containing protein n=1 Tax=Psychromonas sp. TaxID=1884585 RepID=UPI0039E33027